MSVTFGWFWSSSAEVAAIVVLVGWVLRRLGFATSPIAITGWKRGAFAVVGVLFAAAILWSISGWISGWSVPSHDTIAWFAGYALGAAIDDAIAKRTAGYS